MAVCVCDNDARGVAFHDAGFPIGNHPSGEGAPALHCEVDVRLGDVGCDIWFEHGEQLCLCAIGVPVAEAGILA